METGNSFLNAGGGWTELVSVAVDFGVGYLTAKQENKKNQELLQRMSELDDKEAEKLKNLIKESATEIAKTKVIFDFLSQQDAKKLAEQTKKERILPLIGLGIGVILLGIIFYKLHRQNG